MISEKIILIPFIISSIYGVYKAYKCYPANSHHRAHILSGAGVILICAAIVSVALTVKDTLSVLLMTIGVIITIFYSKEHIAAKEREMKEMGKC